MRDDATSNTDVFRFSLGALLMLTLFFAIVCVGWASFGYRGIAPACASVAFIWFALSRTNSRSLVPINCQRMTVVELLTILGVCAFLHGVSLPAVQSGPHRRRLPAPPTATLPMQSNKNPATPSTESAEK
ncbi:MAG: hypothetical protein U1A77_22940 [Pirellulales bacterium]